MDTKPRVWLCLSDAPVPFRCACSTSGRSEWLESWWMATLLSKTTVPSAAISVTRASPKSRADSDATGSADSSTRDPTTAHSRASCTWASATMEDRKTNGAATTETIAASTETSVSASNIRRWSDATDESFSAMPIP